MNAQRDLRERVASTGWYHTLELAPGVVTPGEFDLRGAADRLPWPDLTGKRCLDVATFDGFYAFEMERRGAAEVVAIDLDDAADLDWLPRQVPPGFARGQEPVGVGFRIAHEVRGSAVQRVSCNVYELSPERVGTFDFVVCGALMQHLRDPLRALLAIRSVCDGQFLSVELVDHWMSLLWRRRPVRRVVGKQRTWELVNVAGHRKMLWATGCDVQTTDVLGMPFGPGFTAHPTTARRRFEWMTRAWAWRALGGSDDPPFSVALSRPAPGLNPMPS